MIAPMTGPRLRAWRFKQNLTQEAASAMFGVHRGTWIRWEDGGKIMFPRMLALAVKALS